MIYLDNAATSWPKPEMVYCKLLETIRSGGGSYGRGNHHMASRAGDLVFEARRLCGQIFGFSNPNDVCFTSNGTEAINLALKGILEPGNRVITTRMEHNSVTRPLRKLEKYGVEIIKIDTSPEEGMSLDQLEGELKRGAKLVVCNHISNVTGTVNPIAEIGELSNRYGALFLVDAAQLAGNKKINVEEMKIDLLAFPGHKGLFGPMGTGGLYIRQGLVLDTLKEGGTGMDSHSLEQPVRGPQRYESGSLNTPVIAAMAEGIRFILDETIESIEEKETRLIAQLMDGLEKLDGVKIFGPAKEKNRGSLVSIQLEGYDPSEGAVILDEAFGIAVRSGLQCARDAHENLGTLNGGGTIRISPNYFNSEQDIQHCLDAIESMCGKG